MKPVEYFDKVAENYNKDRTSGIHGYFANKELIVVMRFLDVKKGEKILDAGCGSGLYCKIIKKLGGKPYGIDASKSMIKNLKKNKIPGKVADIQNFNLHKKFDKALSVGVFEFIRNRDSAVKSIKKHLKKKGMVVIHYPRKSLFSLLYFLFHFILHKIKIKLFTKKELEILLISNGFTIEKHRKADPFASVIRARLN